MIPNINRPNLVEFTLDINGADNTGTLFLSFSETINAYTFDFTHIILQDGQASSGGNGEHRVTVGGVHAVGSSHTTTNTDRKSVV